MPDLLPCVEIEVGQAPDASVILLHGLGADGHDLVPVVKALDFDTHASIRFVLPHAPIRPVAINGGYRMRAWYDIAEADLSHCADLAGVRTARAQIEALIAREQSRGIAPGRVILAGFSQGGAVALYTALRHPARLAGMIALSTYIIDGPALANEASEANRDVPIFMAHGTEDPVVRFEWGEASRRALENAGYSVEWHAFSMGHAVIPMEIEAAGRYVASRLARRRPDSSVGL